MYIRPTCSLYQRPLHSTRDMQLLCLVGSFSARVLRLRQAVLPVYTVSAHVERSVICSRIGK